MLASYPRRLLLLAALCLVSDPIVCAQQTYRPGGSQDDPIEWPRDLSGYSVRSPRVRIVHTTDSALAGGSLDLPQEDPWLGYLWGRGLVQRGWLPRGRLVGQSCN